jgi:predicted kinase
MFEAINYHLVGFAYAGKSTLAKELEAKHGFARISIDDIKWRLGFRDVGDDDVSDEVWRRVFQEADELLSQHLRAGRPVANEYAWVTSTGESVRRR